MNTPLKSKSLNAVRDLFVFSCFTGLAYVDLCNLTNQQIVKTDDGTFWLHTSRQKTGNDTKIPLLDVPLKIIEKYKVTGSNGRVFPMKGRCCTNRQLKKIAKLCGVERHLTFHMSRHTFATETCLSQGVPIETVSRMMGHKRLNTTQIYAKITHSKVNEEMEALSEKLTGKYFFVS